MDFPGRWQAAIQNLLVTAVCLATQVVMAQPPQEDVIASLPNIKSPTFGGKQFWTDHAWRQGWRLQRNAITGHWRLLDAGNVRHAWGSRLACEAALESEGLENTLPTTHAVVLLHGLMRSAESMRSLGVHLAKAGEGHQFSIVYFEYASSRSSISDHAHALGEFVASLPPEATLSLVGHSMGNIVARHWIGDLQRAGDDQTLNRLKQVVMLGPPNQGASIARLLSKTGVFGWVVGKAGLELGPGWTEFERKLATPTCPFGIVAGSIQSPVSNPLVKGASDFVVTVEETKLPGATDFLQVDAWHTFLMDDPQVQQAVQNFLVGHQF